MLVVLLGALLVRWSDARAARRPDAGAPAGVAAVQGSGPAEYSQLMQGDAKAGE